MRLKKLSFKCILGRQRDSNVLPEILACGWSRNNQGNLEFVEYVVGVLYVNNTNMVLIPKIKSPPIVKDYRLISLSNVVYKIISKTIANRLNHHLHELIGLNQNAFVPADKFFIMFL